MPSCLTKQTVTDLAFSQLLRIIMNMYCHHNPSEYQVLYSILCLAAFRRLWKYGSFHTDCRCQVLLNYKQKYPQEQTPKLVYPRFLSASTCFRQFFIVIQRRKIREISRYNPCSLDLQPFPVSVEVPVVQHTHFIQMHVFQVDHKKKGNLLRAVYQVQC